MDPHQIREAIIAGGVDNSTLFYIDWMLGYCVDFQVEARFHRTDGKIVDLDEKDYHKIEE